MNSEKQNEVLNNLLIVAGLRNPRIQEVVGIVISTKAHFTDALRSMKLISYPRAIVMMQESSSEGLMTGSQDIQICTYPEVESFENALRAAEKLGKKYSSPKVAYTIQDADVLTGHLKHIGPRGELQDFEWTKNTNPNSSKPRLLKVRLGGWGETTMTGCMYSTLLHTANIANEKGYFAATLMQANQNNDYKDKPFADGLLQGGIRIFLPRCPHIYSNMLEHEKDGGALDYASNVTLMRLTGSPCPVMLNRVATLKFGIGWEDKIKPSYVEKVNFVAECLRDFGASAYAYPVKNRKTCAIKIREKK